MPFILKEIALEPGNWADELKGLRIIQISNLFLHKKSDLARLHRLVKKINEAKPDLIVFNGGLIKGLSFGLKAHFLAFKELEAPAYYVSGKHDFLYGRNTLKRELRQAQVQTIDNACAHLIINDTPLQIVALSHHIGKRDKNKRPVKELFSSLKEEVSTLLLSNDPHDVHHIQGYRVDVHLSLQDEHCRLRKLLKKEQTCYKGLHIEGKTLLYATTGVYGSQNKKSISKAEIPLFTIL